MKNPEYSLPYKFRSKGPKHQSRSTSAKSRARKGDGRFSKVQKMVDFSIDIDDIQAAGHQRYNDIIVDKI